MAVFDRWLEELPREDRQNFINGMSDVYQFATNSISEKNSNAIPLAINKYKEMKFHKLRLRNIADKNFKSALILYAGVFAAFIAINSLLSLVLILLSIERNTRKQD